MSRLETTLEWAQNTCEPPRIILHQNCHLSQWLPPSPHSRLLTLGLAVPYSSLCGSLHGYLSSCRRLLQALKPTRFPTMLFVIMHCCLFQLISAHAAAHFYAFIFVASHQITQSLTPAHALTNAIALELQQLHLMY